MTEQAGERANAESSILIRTQEQATREFMAILGIHPLNHEQQVAVHSLITNLVCAEALDNSSRGDRRHQYWDRALTSLKLASGTGVPEQVVRAVFLDRESLRPAVEAMS